MNADEEKQLRDNESGACKANIIMGLLILTTITNIKQCDQKNELYKEIEKLNPTQIHLQYVNNDTLQDLIYKTGEIYLQKIDGSFVSYDTIAKQEKAKIDSIYTAKKDSIKNTIQNYKR